ncbi:MAG: PIN domain-containing protein [Bryobacteraceae bacterium]
MRLAADANVLLSAVLGGRANAVLSHPEVEDVFTTEVTFAEVQEYAAQLARKKRLSLELVLLAMAALPVRIVSRDEYAASVRLAEKKIGKRDPDDVEILALAIHLRIPVWSNDNDFEGTRVEWYTTARLLKKLVGGQ